MKVTYDEGANAAYIYLRREGGRVKNTDASAALVRQGIMINLDFDFYDRLVGIEVLAASKLLPSEVLEEAERIG